MEKEKCSLDILGCSPIVIHTFWKICRSLKISYYEVQLLLKEVVLQMNEVL
jgi:hypothetical protein